MCIRAIRNGMLHKSHTVVSANRQHEAAVDR